MNPYTHILAKRNEAKQQQYPKKKRHKHMNDVPKNIWFLWWFGYIAGLLNKIAAEQLKGENVLFWSKGTNL